MIVPQLIMIGSTLFFLGVIALAHGREQPPFNVFLTFLDDLIIQWLLYWGGFYDELIRRLSGH